ncbi:ATP-grasp domain-containing protein [Rhodothermus bifroesti]|uniref:ATP-grasp domain-containing protein n=1 Tax=Rhodothermus bifroesti TaxID=2823335 RepID=UPI001AF00E54
MGRLAIYVERYTIARREEHAALLRYRDAAEALGHEVHFLFRNELHKIPRYDALFIRALTHPLNASYVAARLAELHGKPVIDDSRSIRICCDKVHMYRRLEQAGVSVPPTRLLTRPMLTPTQADRLFAELGAPLVLKAPQSAFSSHVERVETVEAFLRTGRRFFYHSDRLIVQQFIPSPFDWRVGVLGGQLLYACRYLIPAKTFKIEAIIDGRRAYARVEGVPLEALPEAVAQAALKAAAAIGQGLYGVDLKVTETGQVVVIEVNDNPTINAGEEDQQAPDVYTRIVSHLLEGKSS